MATTKAHYRTYFAINDDPTAKNTILNQFEQNGFCGIFHDQAKLVDTDKAFWAKPCKCILLCYLEEENAALDPLTLTSFPFNNCLKRSNTLLQPTACREGCMGATGL
jgi:hypothetical protein